MKQLGEDEDEASVRRSAGLPAQFPVSEPSAAAELRCVQCDAVVHHVVCGRKSPCPACGFPYPIGDCSDLAEN